MPPNSGKTAWPINFSITPSRTFLSLFLGNAALLLLRSLSGLFLLASNDYDKELRKSQEITPDDFLIHLSTNAEKTNMKNRLLKSCVLALEKLFGMCWIDEFSNIHATYS